MSKRNAEGDVVTTEVWGVGETNSPRFPGETHVWRLQVELPVGKEKKEKKEKDKKDQKMSSEGFFLKF